MFTLPNTVHYVCCTIQVNNQTLRSRVEWITPFLWACFFFNVFHASGEISSARPAEKLILGAIQGIKEDFSNLTREQGDQADVIERLRYREGYSSWYNEYSRSRSRSRSPRSRTWSSDRSYSDCRDYRRFSPSTLVSHRGADREHGRPQNRKSHRARESSQMNNAERDLQDTTHNE